MAAPQPAYHFGNVTIDVLNLQLTVDGSLRPLEPKAFRVLQFLVENPGRAVTKEELLASVWPDVAVTDNALTRAIAQLRKALGDDSKSPRFIETIPTVGYRFLPQPDAPPPPAPPVEAPTHRPRLYALALLLPLLAAAYFYFRPSAPGPLVFRTNAQLTSGNGLDFNATFSPDGKLLAYASDRTGTFEIYVRPVDGDGRDTQVTANAGQNLFPSFSPDGQFLAFSSFLRPGIYRTPTHGGNVERLTQFGAQPVWSPDGKWIAFLSHDRPTLATTDFYFRAPESSIWIIPATGGAPRELTPHASFSGGQSSVSWSPDSKEIRFANYIGRVASLWTLQLDGNVLRKRFELDHRMMLGSTCFSPDSRQLFFVTAELNGDIGVWRLPMNPATLTPTGNPELVYRPSLGSPRDLALSPDATRIAYSAVLNSSQIRILNPSGGPPTDLIRDTGYRYNMPVWSGDGKSILYTKYPVARPAQTWLDHLDGKPPVQLSGGDKGQYFPTFIKEGVAVRTLHIIPEVPKQEVQDILLADGSVTRYPLAVPMAQPSFGRDGRTIVYHSLDPLHQVWKLDLPTGQRTQLTSGPTPHGFALLSPDGQWVQVQRILRGTTQVWILPAAGGTMTPLIDTPGIWYAGGWSEDGKELVVAGNTGNGWALHAVSRETRQLRRLSPDLPLRQYIRYPRWSPTGDRIAYEYNESKGNVFVAELGK